MGVCVTSPYHATTVFNTGKTLDESDCSYDATMFYACNSSTVIVSYHVASLNQQQEIRRNSADVTAAAR